jgi:hypothetical protein
VQSNAECDAKRAKEQAEAKEAQRKIDKAAQAVATVVKDLRKHNGKGGRR